MLKGLKNTRTKCLLLMFAFIQLYEISDLNKNKINIY